jgi:hypothetical protein
MVATAVQTPEKRYDILFIMEGTVQNQVIRILQIRNIPREAINHPGVRQ